MARQTISSITSSKNIEEKFKIYIKVSEVTTSSRHIILKGTLHRYTSHWRSIKKLENSHGGSLNHWVGGLMKITVQIHCDIQYIAMILSGYVHTPTKPSFFTPFLNISHPTYHAPSSWSYHVFKKDTFQSKSDTTSMYLQNK